MAKRRQIILFKNHAPNFSVVFLLRCSWWPDNQHIWALDFNTVVDVGKELLYELQLCGTP